MLTSEKWGNSGTSNPELLWAQWVQKELGLKQSRLAWLLTPGTSIT